MVERTIVLDSIDFMLKEDKDYVDNLKLNSEDMFRIFQIMAKRILGIKIIKWKFDCEKCITRIWIE